jgi:hypothetical protein
LTIRGRAWEIWLSVKYDIWVTFADRLLPTLLIHRKSQYVVAHWGTVAHSPGLLAGAYICELLHSGGVAPGDPACCCCTA